MLMLISLSITMWRLPTIIDTFAEKLSGGGDPTESILSAMGAAVGVKGEEATSTNAEPTIIAARGRELSPRERTRLLRQARRLAPLPLDGKRAKPSEPPADQPTAKPPAAHPDGRAIPTSDYGKLQKQLEEAVKKISNPN